MLGGSAYSSIWIKSPFEQIIRVDKTIEIPGTNLDLLHLSSPANQSRAIMPLGIPFFQPSLGVNDTCYAVGYSEDYDDRTETALLRPNLIRCDNNHLCFTIFQSPQSCSVRIIIIIKSQVHIYFESPNTFQKNK